MTEERAELKQQLSQLRRVAAALQGERQLLPAPLSGGGSRKGLPPSLKLQTAAAAASNGKNDARVLAGKKDARVLASEQLEQALASTRQRVQPGGKASLKAPSAKAPQGKALHSS